MSTQKDTGTLSATIKLKDIVYESFQDYKLPSMVLVTSRCDWKCARDLKLRFDQVCQNCLLTKKSDLTFNIEEIYARYECNSITSAVVFSGLEPFLQFDEIFSVVDYFRSKGCEDDFVIYTGYYPDEVFAQIEKLKQYKNIIIKFGRFVPQLTSAKTLDEELGIDLASSNQFALRIS